MTALLLQAGALLQAAPFAVPADGPLPFRRDRLPVDVETMTSLSRQLGTLAAGQGGGEAAERRALAQTLALALALDPGNRGARDMLEACARGSYPEGSQEPQALERARSRVWQVISWLDTPEAGADGRALAACLTDVMALADPEHPRVSGWSGETGSWNGWVPALKAYEEEKVVVAKVDEEKPDEIPGKKPDESASAIRLETAKVSTPLWTQDPETNRYVLKSVVVTMKAKPLPEDERGRPLAFEIEHTERGDSFRQVSEVLRKALAGEHGELPRGVGVSLTCGQREDYLVTRNHGAISGAAAVLMSAALTGVEPDATVIGLVTEDGSFKLPPRFWDKLRALSKGPGGRLIVPAEATEHLVAILALEEPEFFFKYEVLLASNLKELLALSAKEPGEPLAGLSARFREIRSRLGGQSCARFVANRFIRQRLSEISQEASWHASAKVLAVQGAGERPTRLPRPILASELRAAIQPMTPLLNRDSQQLLAATIDTIYEECRAEVDRLANFVDIRDRDIHTKARDLAASLRSLSRTVSRTASSPEGSYQAVNTDFKAFKRAHESVLDELIQLAGDEEPSVLATRERRKREGP